MSELPSALAENANPILNQASTNKQIFVKQEQTKICTGRCPVLQGSDAERQGIQREPYPKQNVLEMCSQPIGAEQKKKDTTMSVLFTFVWAKSNVNRKSTWNQVKLFTFAFSNGIL